MQLFHLKVSKHLKVLRKNKSSFFLIFLGFSIFLFGAINYYRVRILSFRNSPKEVSSNSPFVPTQIIIPSISIDLPIEEGEIKNGVWEISYNYATHLKTSANPKSNGNIVIYGHNKKAIFGNLPYLKVGETINIKVSNGEILRYKLIEKIWANPNQIELVSPTNSEQLTIFTCWGILDNQRVILKAIPIL